MEAVLYKIENGVAIVTLNRPERYNAVNQDIIEGLNDVFNKVKKRYDSVLFLISLNKVNTL